MRLRNPVAGDAGLAGLRARLRGGRGRRGGRWPGPEDGPWREAEFAVVDVETTGLDLRRDEIVSVGVVVVAGGKVTADRWYQVVRPTRPISVEAMKVHSLTREEVEGSPSLPEVLPSVRDHLQGRVLVAHAAWVERAFLDRALPGGERLPADVVDTAALARAAGVAAAGSHEPALEWLAGELGLPVHTPHHALGDAYTTAEVLLVLATRLEAGVRARGGSELTVADLVRLSGRRSSWE